MMLNSAGMVPVSCRQSCHSVQPTCTWLRATADKMLSWPKTSVNCNQAFLSCGCMMQHFRCSRQACSTAKLHMQPDEFCAQQQQQQKVQSITQCQEPTMAVLHTMLDSNSSSTRLVIVERNAGTVPVSCRYTVNVTQACNHPLERQWCHHDMCVTCMTMSACACNYRAVKHARGSHEGGAPSVGRPTIKVGCF